MNALLIVLFIIIGAVVGTLATVLFIKGRKEGLSFADTLLKIRPIISEALIIGIKFYQAGEVSYEALAHEVIGYVKGKVDAADFLLQVEKDALTYEFIQGLLEPQLKKLWDSNMFNQLPTEIATFKC
jgi:hypothetical protein